MSMEEWTSLVRAKYTRYMGRVLLKPHKLQKNAQRIAEQYSKGGYNCPIKFPPKYKKEVDYNESELGENEKQNSQLSQSQYEMSDLDMIS